MSTATAVASLAILAFLVIAVVVGFELVYAAREHKKEYGDFMLQAKQRGSSYFEGHMIRQIQHQTQPTGNTCVCTCIAMLTGKPAQEVVDKWHDLYYSHHEPLMNILEEEGLRVECHYSAGSPRILPGKLYLLTVPSLNIEGSLHQVLVDWRDEAVGPVCLDPAKGLPDRKYYTLSEDEWDDVTEARFLTSWVLDFTIKGWK